MKRNTFFSRHKALALVLLVFLVSTLLLLIYSASVIARTMVDCPKVVARATTAERSSLRLEDLSQDEVQILLSVEDPNFYSHSGIDLGTPGSGWTTITQGIVKVYFYDGFTPGVFHYRKFEQSLIAWTFDRNVDKETQLRIFINSAYLGSYHGQETVGFQAAARAYFRKDFSELTRTEYISLVAMLVAPNEINVLGQPEQNRVRSRKILHLLNGECKPSGFTDVYYDACSSD